MVAVSGAEPVRLRQGQRVMVFDHRETGSGPPDPGLPVIVTEPVRRRERSRMPGRRSVAVAAIAAAAFGVLFARLWPYAGRPAAPVAAPSDTALAASCAAPLPSPRIAVNLPPAVMAVNETAGLGVGIDGATAGVQVAVCGLPPKSTVSIGRPAGDTTWTLAASELPEATLAPPPGFAGEMQIGVVLVTSDGAVADRRTLTFLWPPALTAAAPPAVTRLDPGIDAQLEDAGRLQAANDLIKARAILRRYATTDARAAFMLADTYDPLSLTIPRTMPDADPAAARLWYRKAAELGAPDADARLERLEKWGPASPAANDAPRGD